VLERWIRFNFKLTSDFALQKKQTQSDALGIVHTRYTITYKGIEVLGAMVITHEKNGKVFSLNGELFNKIENETAQLNYPSCFDAGVAVMNASKWMWQDFDQEQLLKKISANPLASYFPVEHKVFISPQNNHKLPLRLAYSFDLYSHTPLQHKIIYIDQATGEVLHSEEKIHTADAAGTAQTKYSGTRTITTDSFTGGFRLQGQWCAHVQFATNRNLLAN
jgi:Zn-dependent metalloprotease